MPKIDIAVPDNLPTICRDLLVALVKQGAQAGVPFSFSLAALGKRVGIVPENKGWVEQSLRRLVSAGVSVELTRGNDTKNYLGPFIKELEVNDDGTAKVILGDVVNVIQKNA